MSTIERDISTFSLSCLHSHELLTPRPPQKQREKIMESNKKSNTPEDADTNQLNSLWSCYVSPSSKVVQFAVTMI
jgi:hypothetical protein